MFISSIQNCKVHWKYSCCGYQFERILLVYSLIFLSAVTFPVTNLLISVEWPQDVKISISYCTSSGRQLLLARKKPKLLLHTEANLPTVYPNTISVAMPWFCFFLKPRCIIFRLRPNILEWMFIGLFSQRYCFFLRLQSIVYSLSFSVFCGRRCTNGITLTCEKVIKVLRKSVVTVLFVTISVASVIPAIWCLNYEFLKSSGHKQAHIRCWTLIHQINISLWE